MLTAAQRGCPFTSTRTITVLKFNSALRYLSYLSPDDDEQREALALALEPDRLARTIDSAVADAASSGNYMTTCHPSEHDRQPGEAARINAVIRGIDTPVLQVFDGPTVFPLTEDPRALDWYGLEGDAEHTWRWSGPNPVPRLLLPFAHAGPVRVTLHIRAIAAQEGLGLAGGVPRSPKVSDRCDRAGGGGRVRRSARHDAAQRQAISPRAAHVPHRAGRRGEPRLRRSATDRRLSDRHHPRAPTADLTPRDHLPLGGSARQGSLAGRARSPSIDTPSSARGSILALIQGGRTSPE